MEILVEGPHALSTLRWTSCEKVSVKWLIMNTRSRSRLTKPIWNTNLFYLIFHDDLRTCGNLYPDRLSLCMFHTSIFMEKVFVILVGPFHFIFIIYWMVSLEYRSCHKNLSEKDKYFYRITIREKCGVAIVYSCFHIRNWFVIAFSSLSSVVSAFFWNSFGYEYGLDRHKEKMELDAFT